MDVVARDCRASLHINAVFDIIDIVAGECALAADAVRSVVIAPDAIDLAVLDDGSRHALLDLHDRKTRRSDFAVFDRHIGSVDIDRPTNVKPRDYRPRLSNDQVARWRKSYTCRYTCVCCVRPSS